MLRSISWFVVMCLLLASSGVPLHAADRGIFYLHTELLPYKHRGDGRLNFRLTRELARQAMLIAARDELGYVTRDPTIGESSFDTNQVRHFVLAERLQYRHDWTVRLYNFDPDGDAEPRDLWPTEPLYTRFFEWTSNGVTAYADMVKRLEAVSRTEFVYALQDARLTKQDKGKAAAPPFDAEAIEKELLKVDYVAQFAAIRSLHRQIRAAGESPELIGMLARAYANMTVLTRHQWNTASDAYAARALLYAQRLVVSEQRTPQSLSTQAYVWAVIGCHHNALESLEEIGETELPAWAQLIDPYARCNRDALKVLAGQDDSLRPWALQLRYELTSMYRYPTWIFESAREIGQVAPMSYGVYAGLTKLSGALGIKRMGASMGPAAFGNFLPRSLDAVADLPASVRALLPLDEKRQAALAEKLIDPQPQDPFSPVPPLLAKELRRVAEVDMESEMTWGALGYLLEEETFVGIANFMNVATDGTESSMAPLVDAVLPFIKDHRYSRFIQSYSLRRGDTESLDRLTKDIEPVDCRPNMSSLEWRLWNVKNDKGERVGYQAALCSQRNYTMPGIIEEVFRSSPEFQPKKESTGQMYYREIVGMSPHCEIAVRVILQSVKEPSLEEVKAWESRLIEDPVAFRLLGEHYRAKGEMEDSIRCFEKSLEKLPTINSATMLANLYYDRADYKKWEATYKDFLKTDDVGLSHAYATNNLAQGFVLRGMWTTAKPYALHAAQTWSAWGLEKASYVCEGLAEWDQSQYYIREMSTGYPTYSGSQWYLWCKRTGRGDVETARKLAYQLYNNQPREPEYNDQVARGVFYILEGNAEKAREHYQAAFDLNQTFTCAATIAYLSRELDDEETSRNAIASIEEKFAKMGDKRDYIDDISLEILEFIKSQEITDQRVDELGKRLKTIQLAGVRSSFCYFFARQLELVGRNEEAELYYRRALNTPMGDKGYATLAGARLAASNGTSRSDGDALAEEDVWVPLKAQIAEEKPDATEEPDATAKPDATEEEE